VSDTSRVDRPAIPRLSDIVTIAVWIAAVSGLIEGILLDISRAWPRVLAPYKASAHLLWIAPTVDILQFVLLACLLRVVAPIVAGRIRPRYVLVCWMVFVFCSVATVALALNVVHIASAIVLAAGASVAAMRALDRRESSVRQYLRRRIWAIPVALVLVGLGVSLTDTWSEQQRYNRLPPVVQGRVK